MSDRKKSRSPAVFGSCILPLVAIVLLGLIILFTFVLTVPGQASAKFGKPQPGLRSLQRYFLSATLLWKADKITQPVDPAGSEVEFQIELGESTPSVIGRLVEQGLISDPGVFRAYLQYTGLDTSLQAGNYRLSPAMSAIEIAQTLQDATPSQITFAVLKGWRIEEVAGTLPTSGIEFSAEAFLSAALFHPPDVDYLKEIPPEVNLEGFLFPGKYEVARDITAPALIHFMLDRFTENLTPELQSGFANQRLSLYRAVILASIVQREAMVAEEMPMIASVFLNRLAAGMNLASDPTVQYAIGYNAALSTWWTNPLSVTDLKIDSPYNTYLYPGLPPTPIANPGLQALRAVAFPAQTSYYYFRALCDGSNRHVFAETYDEHLRNACP